MNEDQKYQNQKTIEKIQGRETKKQLFIWMKIERDMHDSSREDGYRLPF
jgi:hypothetical protein